MSRDTSFYYSFLVLPPRKRSAMIAVWDFCRAVDDAVDESDSPARAAEEVAVWRSELDAVFLRPDQLRQDCGDPQKLSAEAEGGSHRGVPEGGSQRRPQTWQGRALAPFVGEFRLPRAPFDDLIEGVEMDLHQARYPTFAALAGYCRRVASSVGLICVEIFGYTDQRAKAYAVNLGIALQLTNIVRDVAADLQRGRIYLPEEDLQRFGVTEADLRAGVVTPAVRTLLRYQCARAREYYRRAADDLPPADAYSLVAAEIMGGIYFEILQRIERAGYDVFSKRIRVPRPYRAVIALRILARTLLRLPRLAHGIGH
jgi:15-cis-phytoene synthase